MDKDEIRQYVAHAQTVIESAPQMDEANTKAAVLRDFLNLLNWTIPDDTQLEYSVKAFSKTYKVDYALILDGAPVAFLEAKGVDTTLSQNHREQLAAYLKNEDVNLGILTNGKEYEFYRREVVDSKVNINSLTKTELASLPERVTTLSAFTKDAIQTDESLKILNRIRKLREARRELEDSKDELAEDVSKLFSENVSDVIRSKSESQAKEMIDRLIIELESEIDQNGDQAEPLVHNQSTKSDEVKEIEAEEFYGIQLLEGETTHTEFTGTKQVNSFVDTVDYLLKNHDLASNLDPLPYIPGRTRPIIHDQTSYNGKEMKQPRQLTNGYYLEVNLSAGQKQRELERLVAKSPLDIRFTGAWTGSDISN